MEALTLDSPKPNQLEVNVFGPGVGESVLVHLGEAEWLLVDSCKGKGRNVPAALDYLKSIGASATDIKIIVASHWHDDHVRGIAECYDAASQAEFYVAASIRPEEFRAIVGLGPMGSKFSSGVGELGRVAAIAASRGVPVREAAGSHRLWKASGRPVQEVWAMSPSYEDQNISRQQMAAMLPKYSPGARRVPAQLPNDTSVVLQLQTVHGAVLLGGDLEHPSSRLRGWHAVMDLQSAPNDKATFFKIPHHGSMNAHCPEVWEHRIAQDAVAVLTPFGRGTTPLPRPSDRDRVRNLTRRGYITSDRRSGGVVRDSATRRTIREATIKFSPQTAEMGHIRARIVGEDWLISGTPQAVAV